ncbi:MAG: type 11 methyltransferase [uncultured bacterium]|nr:MAG: type 11 methyltransferase [uncultured bacterium]
MNLYHQKIFPWIVDTFLSQKAITELREKFLKDASGRVIEIGFGTGLNLDHYPANIKELVIIEPNIGMTRRALERIKKAPFPVTVHRLKGNKLPFDKNVFDTAVSSFTICSVDDAPAVLGEIRRVLKKGGVYRFMEHGLSNDRCVQHVQNIFNPVQKILGDGCHINRDISELLKQNFSRLDIEEFYFKKAPKIMGFFTLGAAS